ncbi:hypothetical protein RI685_16330 (plasmid) [Clavibacter michiganensis]|uniref:hypothetical protein n=1 Tax=Clavibacter michiganensis TaxID=28447 RepID=UPI003DA183C5
MDRDPPLRWGEDERRRDASWSEWNWCTDPDVLSTSVVRVDHDRWLLTLASPSDHRAQIRDLTSSTFLRQLRTIEAYRWEPGHTHVLPPNITRDELRHVLDGRPDGASSDGSFSAPYDDGLDAFLRSRGWTSNREWKDELYFDEWRWLPDEEPHPWTPTTIMATGREFIVAPEYRFVRQRVQFYVDREPILRHVQLLELIH